MTLNDILTKFQDVDEKLREIMTDLDALGSDTVVIQHGIAIAACTPFIRVNPPPPPPLFLGCNPRIPCQEPPIRGSDLRRIAELQHQWLGEMLAIFEDMGAVDGG